MPPPSVKDLALYALVLALMLFLHLGLHRYAYDDAYIHFRNALHLVEHGQPYFNLGEAVLSDSAPAWMLLVSLLFFLFGPGLVLVAVGNALATTAAVAAFHRLFAAWKGDEPSLAESLAMIVLVAATLAPSSCKLMETPSALLCIGLGTLALTRGRAWGLGLLSLAVFFRPEAVVFLALVGGGALALGAVPRLRAAAWAAVVAAPFAAFELFFYGAVIPQSVAAKSIVYSPERLHTILFILPDALLVYPWLQLSFAALGAFVATLLAARLWLDRRELLRFDPMIGLLVSGAVLAGLYIGKATLIFDWYRPLVWTPVLVGGFALLGRYTSVLPRLLLLALAVPAVLPLGYAVYATAVDPAWTPGFFPDARARKYIQVGEQLWKTFPGETLLSTEVGGLGWGFRGKILDGVGLVSPAALKHHPMRVPEDRPTGLIGALPPGFVAEHRPGLIVGYDVFLGALLRSPAASDYVLFSEPIFLEEDLARTSARSLWGSPALRVLVRKDLAARVAEPVQ